MKIFAIDTTGLVCSVAIVEEEKVIAEITTNNKKTHAEMLVPMIDQLFQLAQVEKTSIDYIACSSGPGSFTGLRIGVSTAKAIAHALKKDIIPVPTLDMLAYNIFSKNMIIAPIMDAKRNQVYTALYQWDEGQLQRLTAYMAVDLQALLEQTAEYSLDTVFVGDGIFPFRDQIVNYSSKFKIAQQHQNLQRAATVGAFAFENIDKAINYQDFVPFYLRLSQAEREYKERHPND